VLVDIVVCELPAIIGLITRGLEVSITLPLLPPLTTVLTPPVPLTTTVPPLPVPSVIPVPPLTTIVAPAPATSLLSTTVPPGFPPPLTTTGPLILLEDGEAVEAVSEED